MTTTDDDAQFEIGIYFVDTTYGKEGDQWEAESTALKAELEAEYGLPLQTDDIGPGWSFPAFAAIITDYWPVAAGLIALFLSGERIEKSLDTWPKLYDRLKRFLTRPVYLDRNGAAVLAMNAVNAKYQATSLTLTGYVAWSQVEGEPPRDTSEIIGIADAPQRAHLSVTVHIFQIKADGKSVKVIVSGADVQVIDMPKRYVVDPDSLPQLFPTHLHSPIFWEPLGRTVATFGFLEETLGRAIFAFTATRPYQRSEIEAAYQKWLPTLERALIDPLAGLIEAYGKAVRDNKTARVDDLDFLLDRLREVSVIRNVLCHGSWRTPDANGRSLPLFVNRKKEIWTAPIDLTFLNQTQKAVAEITCAVLNSVTREGWQFPGSNGPGQVIWK